MKKIMKQTFQYSLLSLVCLILTGCGHSSDRADVNGQVTFQGSPVSGGSLTFVPTSGTEGKPAAAKINPDGTYQLGTNYAGDGAIIGRMEIHFSPEKEHPEDLKRGQSLPKSPYDGLTPLAKQVEITAGSNQVNIELVPKPKKTSRRS